MTIYNCNTKGYTYQPSESEPGQYVDRISIHRWSYDRLLTRDLALTAYHFR